MGLQLRYSNNENIDVVILFNSYVAGFISTPEYSIPLSPRK